MLLDGIAQEDKRQVIRHAQNTSKLRLLERLSPTSDPKILGAHVTQTNAGQSYGQIFHLYSYACLDAAPVAGFAAPSVGQYTPFDSPVEQALYELATATDTTEQDYIPHSSHVKQLKEQGHIALWANWQGLILHDNVAYVGIQPSKFLLEGLAHNVEMDYFHLYLLVLYQKIRVSFLSEELVRRDTLLHHNLNKAQSMWDDFMRFRNHYWFEEVTSKPQGIELYHRFQKALFVVPLYETVSKEVRDLQEYYGGKATRRVTALLSFLTVIGLPITLSFGLFSNARFHNLAWFSHDLGRHFLLTLAGLCLASFTVASLWIWVLANWRRRT